jgi:hypothetical protein
VWNGKICAIHDSYLNAHIRPIHVYILPWPCTYTSLHTFMAIYLYNVYNVLRTYTDTSFHISMSIYLYRFTFFIANIPIRVYILLRSYKPHICLYTSTYIHLLMLTYIYAHTYTCLHTSTSTYLYMYTNFWAHIRILVYILRLPYTYTCLHTTMFNISLHV